MPSVPSSHQQPQGRKQNFIWGRGGGPVSERVFSPIPSVPFLPSLPLPSFPRRTSNPAMGSVGTLLASSSWERITFGATRHVYWDVKYTKNALAAEPQPQTHFWCILHPSKRVWWLQLSSYCCYVCYRVVAYYLNSM